MDSQLLDTPEGITARLGWDPAMSPHDRIRALAREIVADRLGVDQKTVLITREAPTNFGHHTLLVASVDDVEVPLTIKTATFRAASIAAVAERGTVFGLDLRDIHPDEETLRDIKRHSHLWDGSSDQEFLTHWTHVQAVRSADARGERVSADVVRLDPGKKHGWVPDRPARYELRDISRGGFVITIAWAPAEVPATA